MYPYRIFLAISIKDKAGISLEIKKYGIDKLKFRRCLE